MGRNGGAGTEGSSKEDPLPAACAAPSFSVLLTLTAACIFPLPGSPGREPSLTPPGCEPNMGGKRAGGMPGQSDAHTAARLSVRAVGMRHRRSEIQPPDS